MVIDGPPLIVDGGGGFHDFVPPNQVVDGGGEGHVFSLEKLR